MPAIWTITSLETNSSLVLECLFYRRNHCVKTVHIRSYSGSYFPTFGLNTERYEASLRIQPECGKIRTRITPNTDTFQAVNATVLPYSLYC